ncbi:hypothetical protein LPTSP3_g09400 [Leptospira kobayashii]|uniref:Uncharacterized protein n=1 Tax=Leptospira kobayashii TaxID=1917830 RepID=A0ABM7UHF6_9LEPT|nr:hypothetical protein [Leptospira kobayashii]BDA78010.1 hypothetical protein LPTSP3_g09400 [Leptospira kobayashii]
MENIRLSAILFFAFFISNLQFAEENTAPKQPPISGYYIILYKGYSINLDVTYNGYTVSSSKDTDISGQADVNFWTVPGKNEIKIKISPRKGKKEDSFGKKASIRLLVGQQGQFPDEGEEITNFEWEEKEDSVLPLEKTIEFTPPFLPPSNLWKSAEKIEWNSDTKKSALEFVDSFSKALNSKDPKQIYPFIEFRAKDTSETRYFPYQPEEEKKALEGMIKAIGSSWKLEKKNVKFGTICNGMIGILTTAKGDPILTAKKGAALPLNLGKIAGKWVIVR